MTLLNLKKLNSLKAPENTIDRINSMLERTKDTSWRPKSKPGHKPSVLGSKCFRKIYYSYWRVKEDYPPDARAYRIFELGNYVETMVKAWLQEIGEYIPYRTKSTGEISKAFDAQFPIKSSKWRIKRGYIDNVAFDGDRIWIYEIKSSNSKKWTALKEPAEDHLIQASIYLQTFNDLLLSGEFDHIPEFKEKKTKAAGVKWLYFNKDTSEIKMFQITEEKLEGALKAIDSKIEAANLYIDNKKLPPKTPDFCKWCNFRKKCKNEFNEVD